MLTLLGLLQTTQSTWAAGADKHPSQMGKNQPSNPPIEHDNNFSLLMHGAYDLGITYTDCDGIRHENEQTIRARSTINVCAKVGTSVSVAALHVPWITKKTLTILMYQDGKGDGKESITVPEEGITMDCGRTALNARCDWSTPFKAQ